MDRTTNVLKDNSHANEQSDKKCLTEFPILASLIQTTKVVSVMAFLPFATNGHAVADDGTGSIPRMDLIRTCGWKIT
jgi:hypothetical protein